MVSMDNLPALANTCCISVAYRQLKTDSNTTYFDESSRYIRVALDETSAPWTSGLLARVVGDEAWLQAQLDQGYSFLMLGSSAALNSSPDEDPPWLPIRTSSLTLLCIDSEGRYNPLDEHFLTPGVICGVGEDPHVMSGGASTGRKDSLKRQAKPQPERNLKPAYRGEHIQLEWPRSMALPQIPKPESLMLETREMLHGRTRCMRNTLRWDIFLTLPLTFEHLREPLWVEQQTYLPWLTSRYLATGTSAASGTSPANPPRTTRSLSQNFASARFAARVAAKTAGEAGARSAGADENASSSSTTITTLPIITRAVHTAASAGSAQTAPQPPPTEQQEQQDSDWDKITLSTPEMAYMRLDARSCTIGMTSSRDTWDWAGTEGDCVVICTTRTPPGASQPYATTKVPRDRFFHLHGVSVDAW